MLREPEPHENGEQRRAEAPALDRRARRQSGAQHRVTCSLRYTVRTMCSRVTYLGPGGSVVTGRTLDWFVPLNVAAWALPPGIEREGGALENPISWTSRFGSLVVTAYDCLSFDGINTAGLTANLLYMGSSEYGDRDASRPGMSVGAWVQWALDSFATVAEAVSALEKDPFQVVGIAVPGGAPPTGHFSLSDISGDSAIFEYLNGAVVIHHGREFQVMTNEPTYDEQLALTDYWTSLDGAMLPGTERAADRFVRASWYLSKAQAVDDEAMSIATVLSIMRNVSVPFMRETDPEHPNISPTLLRVVSDQGRGRFFVELTDMPNVFWIDLGNLSLDAGASAKRLEIDGGPIRAGESSADFVEMDAPYEFSPEA